MKRLQWEGWNSVAVITSVSSSMFTGLMSTISVIIAARRDQTTIKTGFTPPRDSLKLWSLILRFQRLIRKSSAEMYVSWSELTEMECM